MMRASIALALLLFLLPGVALAQAEKRIALLIGNQAYTPEIGALQNPHNDVALLERTLKSLGFQVTTVRDADLATLTSRTVTCVADPGYLADPVVSADAVTFSEITAPETARRCKRILTVSLKNPGQPRPVPAATNCLQWSGASLHGATVWSEVGPTDPDQYQSKAYVRESADSPAQSLGSVVTDTILACGNWILWETRSMNSGVESYQINRWRPGLDQPQRVYSTPAGAALTPMTCQDNTVYLEAAYLATTPTYTETISASVA